MDTMDESEWEYPFIQEYLFVLLFIPEINRKQNGTEWPLHTG
jgi:hypothetical protein